MRALVCGSRTFDDREFLFARLDDFHRITPITLVIEGEAAGADTLAKMWAIYKGVPWVEYPANWVDFGRAAGPIRNRQMLVEGKPDIVIAFIDKLLKDSRGTKNMIMQASKAKVQTRLHSTVHGYCG